MEDFNFNALCQAPLLGAQPTHTYAQDNNLAQTLVIYNQILLDLQSIRQSLDSLKNQHQAMQDSLDLIRKHMGYDSSE